MLQKHKKGTSITSEEPATAEISSIDEFLNEKSKSH
jgi:hypothetical protein